MTTRDPRPFATEPTSAVILQFPGLTNQHPDSDAATGHKSSRLADWIDRVHCTALKSADVHARSAETAQRAGHTAEARSHLEAGLASLGLVNEIEGLWGAGRIRARRDQ